MAHGNKKYNFEELKSKGDEITVKTKNIYSLNNRLKLWCKENEVDYSIFNAKAISLQTAKVTRMQ